MHQSPLEIQTKKKPESLLHCFQISSDPAAFPQPALQRAPAFHCPFGSLCPGALRCARQRQPTGTNSSAPRLPGMRTQKGSESWKWHLPKRRKKLSLFCLENPLVALLGEPSRAVCEVRYCRPCCSPYSSSGQGNATLQRARLLPGSHGSIPSYSASDSSPTAPPRCIALHYIALPARRHCCITVQPSSKMYNWFFHLANTNWLLPLQSQL